jgi:hypothetical protein
MELAMAEVLTLLISLLFFLGVVLMSRMFKDVAKKIMRSLKARRSIALCIIA